MTLDVLIVTHQRPKQLRLNLDHLSTAISHSSLNIKTHVLINGPDEESVQLLTERNLPNLYFYKHAVTVKPGQARNLLLERTTADWAFFIDDDAYPSADIFIRFQELLEKHPRAMLFGGPNLTPQNSSLFQKLNGLILGSWWGALQTRARYSPVGQLRLARESFLSSCNLFIKNTVFQSSRYPNHYRTAEESYLILNILKTWPNESWYAPSLTVYHARRNKLWGYLKQIFGYAAGRGQLICDKKTRSIVYVLPSLVLITLLFSPLSNALQLFVLFSQKLYFILTAANMTYYALTARLWSAPYLLLLYPITHTAYGLGLIFGVLRSLVKKMFSLFNAYNIFYHESP